MKPLDLVNGLSIASPCKASWNAMTGDDRARHCALCDKHVYNIAALTSVEVVDLVKRTEGEFCGRLHMRRDGTVLTADCPVGQKAFNAGRMHRYLSYGVLGLAFFTTGAFLKGASVRELSWPPTGPTDTFTDWKDWALQTLGFGRLGQSPRRYAYAGAISLSPATLKQLQSELDASRQTTPDAECETR